MNTPTNTGGELYEDAFAAIPSLSIQSLLSMRDAMVERFEKVLDLLAETQAIAMTAHIDQPRLYIDQQYRIRAGIPVSGHSARRVDGMQAIRKIIDGSAWAYLMDESGLRSLMDAKARREWEAGLAAGEFPDLTAENVRTTFETLHGARADMFERGVIECFRKISWHYKTNLPQRFGRRLVITFLTQWHGTHPNLDRANEVDDLLRIFHVLDGRPEPDHRTGFYRQACAAITARTPVDNEYITVRLFKNGNGHLTFKRADLIDRMNAILAKHHPGALPAPRS
jgi:hypothetical protein